MKFPCLRKGLAIALCALGAGLATSPVAALVFADNFDNNAIDPAWWASGSVGTSTIQAVNGRVELSQGASADSWAALTFRLPVVGDFTVTVDYALLSWPDANKARVVLNAYANDSSQLAIERVSDSQYAPSGSTTGEVYLTDFSGQGILGTATGHALGTMRLVRTGDVVQGSFRDGAEWQVIGTYSSAGEGNVARVLGMGLFSVAPVTPGVRVAIDNFSLNAPSVPAIPEPETYSMLLAGLATLGYIARRRRQP